MAIGGKEVKQFPSKVPPFLPIGVMIENCTVDRNTSGAYGI